MRTNPYKNDALNRIYELLFCDDPGLYRPEDSAAEAYPLTQLFGHTTSDEVLLTIVDDPNVESRLRLIASRILSTRGKATGERRLFGIVVEVGMDQGLDVLAAYADGTARYINFSGKLIVWETRTADSDEIIAEIFAAAGHLVDQIGPWDGERRPPPDAGNARLSFLVSDGLYFGEGPLKALHADPLGGRVIECAIKLMTYLIEHGPGQNP